MRDGVCIVLNEREAQKARLAESLQNSLSELGLRISRLEVTAELEESVLERRPKFLILDYLLGDYTTGLDILGKLRELPERDRPQCFFLTDEPSVQVAVQALKMGAVDYLEIDSAQSVNRLIREIKASLDQEALHAYFPHTVQKQLKLADLVAQAPASKELLKKAKALCLTCPPVIALVGKPGSGLSTWAKALLNSRPKPAQQHSLDLSCYHGPLPDALGVGSSARDTGLGRSASIIIEHAEEDTGELIDLVCAHYFSLWGAKASQRDSLVLCSSSAQAVQAWKKKLSVTEVLTIAPLVERSDDIPPLVQRFVEEASEALSQRVSGFDGELLGWMRSLPWPGEIRELRAVVLGAAAAQAVTKTALKTSIEELKASWEEEQQQAESLFTPMPFAAAQVLEQNNYNYRAAAARLGCSVQKLHQLIKNGGVS